MPTLRVVPDPPGGSGHVTPGPDAPDELGLTAASDVETSTHDLPIRWFSCADPSVGATVRAHVLTVLNVLAVDTDTMADAMVLVSELITNVRDHTVSDEVGVRVRATPQRVVVAVVEQVPTDAPPDGRLLPGPFDLSSVQPLHDRGRGLRILDSMAAEWGFVRSAGVTTTWFALAAASPAARPPDVRRF